MLIVWNMIKIKVGKLYIIILAGIDIVLLGVKTLVF